MKRFYLTFVVCIGGAAVLAIEILGTRILGPFYGVSLFLWSALITVTLAALSVGYALGGRWADRSPSQKTLSLIVIAAGIWIMLIPAIKQPFLLLAEPLGLRAAVLLASTVLFFPPLFLLGMIGPYAIRLKTLSLETVGRTAGNLFAISTVASVVSALLTGFLLIPNVGITRLTLMIGAILMGTGLAGLQGKTSNTLAQSAGWILVCAALLGLVFAKEETSDPVSGLVTIQQSPYAELRVLDKNGLRHLLIDGGVHSIVDTATGASFHRYTGVMNLPRYFFSKPGRMLLIGLGAGSLAKDYTHERWSVDAVEIDEDVVDVARRYFNLQPEDANTRVMDGRQFLATSQDTYDVILLDAFGSSSIPFHLVTVEAFGLVADRLSDNGLFAINVETQGWDDPIIRWIAATLRIHFDHVLALPMAEPPDRLGNVILLASRRALQPEREPERNETLDPNWRYGLEYARIHAWDNRFEPDVGDVEPLTDDLNRSDLRAEEINMIARKELHLYFGESGGSW